MCEWIMSEIFLKIPKDEVKRNTLQYIEIMCVIVSELHVKGLTFAHRPIQMIKMTYMLFTSLRLPDFY